MATGEQLNSREQAWLEVCTTELPSDLVVEVEKMNFHLQRSPMMSKSRKLHQLISDEEANHSSATTPAAEEGEKHCHLVLADFPGGSETFELAAKFCFGAKINLSSSNVVPLRCAGEFLEMTEEHSEENLIAKTETFLSQSVLNSLKDSIIALKSSQRLMPLAETLGIPRRCVDSIISEARFRWPVSDSAYTLRGRRKAVIDGEDDSWFEELTLLGLPMFKQLIIAMKESELKPEIIEICLMHYAKKHIPGLSRSNRKALTSSSSEAEQKELLEIVISNLSSKHSTQVRFLFGLLRAATMLSASKACRDVLEKKIGSQLDEVTLDDLLIPSYSYLNETLYDIDCVARILRYFLEEERNVAAIDGCEPTSPALMLVGKLIDCYLSEIASDANLKPKKFYDLAISVPDQARLFHDGLYRAVDVYLKAHPWVSKSDREKICEVLDCQKLTLEACTHAAQNERLPLRAVVRVLFFEQLQLRHTIAGTLMAAQEPARPSVASADAEWGGAGEGCTHDRGDINTWQVTVRENQVLRLDMDSMRSRVHQLERECSSMKRVIEKMDRNGPQGGGVWLALGKKFGCKFKTQVCDSHEPTTVVDKRDGRPHRRPHRE
ncbi:BTB/POZ domain-containing protein At5g66560-like isoform X1 [Vigna unguiculata]|uniref:BTB/POZ domain-containing protein At5g66560-like isoform X1 n=1 Tax=Vigna unguiculata TaxID=3917 RepID=UPI00101668E3|nr:BTB/POZ domain-containing protein At5g66560-like isoform X1 [Vigna unguiculata]